MNIFKKMKINKCLKIIEPEVDKQLMEMGLLTVENGQKKYAFGSINVKWQIQKDLMKEKFNIDWKSPQDENPYTKFD